MPETHCTVTVTFSSPENIFSYESSTPDWVVDSNGNITAPDPNLPKTITFEINDEVTPGATFTGFQLAVFPDKETWPWGHANSLEGLTTTPAFPPPSDPPTVTLDIPAESHCYYRLAVNGTWSNEPKIHNDGSE